MFPLRDLNPTRQWPWVTTVLILANAAVFFLWQPLGNANDEAEFLYANAAIPCELTSGEPLSFAEIASGVCSDREAQEAFPDKLVVASSVVSMFLHGGLLHLASNMWFLWLFGNNIEETYGRLRYLSVYLVAGVVSTLAYVAVNADSTIPFVGASGAIAGVLGSYLVLYPTRWVLSLIFVIVIPVPAAIFLGLWLLGQFAITDPGVAWEAHVAGFLFGVALTLLVRTPLNRRLARLHRGR